MSQRLPHLPNLDHLKKQAKEVLRVCRVGKPHSQLADAQNAVARGYGFQSWPILKAHVESMRMVRGAPSDPSLRPKAIQPHQSGSSHPIAGTWSSGDIVVAIDVCRDLVSLTQVVTDAAGHQSASRFAFVADSQEHDVEGHDFRMLATWTDPRTLDTTVKRGDAVVGSATYEVSEAGTSLTLTSGNQRLAFKRVSL